MIVFHDNITVMWRRDGTAVEVECGTYWAGTKQLCERCLRAFEKDYPQGWRYYPGDVCLHGRYVGGSGIDYMCGACEMGE